MTGIKPDPRKRALFNQYAEMYPDESDEELINRVERLGLSAVDRPIDPSLRIPAPQVPDPMTIGAPGMAANVREDVSQAFGRGPMGGFLGQAAGLAASYIEDPKQAIKGDVEAIKGQALGLIPTMAEHLIKGPVQLAGAVLANADMISKDYSLTWEQADEKVRNLFFTAAPLLLGPELYMSPSLLRYRAGIGTAASTVAPSALRVVAESAVQGAKIGSGIAVGQAASEAKTGEEFGQKLFTYSIATLPFSMALDVGLNFATLGRTIHDAAEARAAVHASYKVEATHDIANAINETKDLMKPLQQAQEAKVKAGLEPDPEIQKDIDRYQARLNMHEKELTDVANSTYEVPEVGDSPIRIEIPLPKLADKDVAPNVRTGELAKSPRNINPFVQRLVDEDITQEHVDIVNSMPDEAKTQLGTLKRQLEIDQQRKTITSSNEKLLNKLNNLTELREEPLIAADEAEFLRKHPKFAEATRKLQAEEEVEAVVDDPIKSQLAALKARVAVEGVPTKQHDLSQVLAYDLVRLLHKYSNKADAPNKVYETVQGGETTTFTRADILAEARRRLTAHREAVESIEEVGLSLDPKTHAIRGLSSFDDSPEMEAKFAVYRSVKNDIVAPAVVKDFDETITTIREHGGHLAPPKEIAERPAPVQPKTVQNTGAPRADYRLPRDVAKSAPRYGYGPKQFELEFASDFDRAAYILQGKTKSKAHDRILQDVMQKTGLSEEEVLAHGTKVRNGIKEMAKVSAEGKLRFESITPQNLGPRVERYKSIDDVLGAKVLEDIYDPANLDPTTGDPHLIAKAGSTLTADVAQQAASSGIETIKTDRGTAATTFEHTGEPPLFTMNLASGEIRPGTDADRITVKNQLKPGDVIGGNTPTPDDVIAIKSNQIPKKIYGILSDNDHFGLGSATKAANEILANPDWAKDRKLPKKTIAELEAWRERTIDKARSKRAIQEAEATKKAIENDVVNPKEATGEISRTWRLEDMPDARIRVGTDGNPEGFAFLNKDDANLFLNRSKMPPIEFDMVPEAAPPKPPDGNGDGPTPPQPVSPKNHEAAWERKPLSDFGKKVATAVLTTRLFSNIPGYLGQVDNLLNTMLVPYVYAGPQWIKQKVVVAQRKFAEMISTVIKPEMNKLTAERLKVVSQHANSMDFKELVTSLRSRVKVNDVDKATVVMMMKQNHGIDINASEVTITPTELAYAERIAIQDADLKKALEVSGSLRSMAEERAKEWQKRESGEYQGVDDTNLAKLKRNFDAESNAVRDKMISDMGLSAPTARAALHLEELISRYKDNEQSHVAVMTLADAIQNKTLSKADFAASKKMTPEEVRLSDQIRLLQDQISGSTNKGTDVKFLNTLKRHRSLFGATPKSLRDIVIPDGTTRHFDAVKNDNFDLENPVNNLLNHSNSTVAYTHGLQASVARAEEALKTEVAKIQNPKIARSVEKAGKAYLAEIMGAQNVEAAVTAEFISELGSQLGVKYDKGKLANFANSAVLFYSGLKLGGRIGLVARDMGQAESIWYIRFGTNLLKNLDGETLERLGKQKELGIVPTMGASHHTSGSEAELAAITKAQRGVYEGIEKLANFGIHASGQSFVFELIHSLAYTDRMRVVGGVLNDLHHGKVTKDAAYASIKLHTYHGSVQEHFNNLVSLEDFEGATQFLARKTANEHGVVYGFANMPTQWRGSIGRLAGQFNTYPTWQRSLYAQLLQSAQSPAEARAIAGRIFATQAATYAASKAVGMKAGPWMLHGSIMPQMGPILASYQNWMDPTQTTDFNDPGDLGEKLLKEVGVASDIFNAIDMNERGFNPASTLMKFLAFPMDKTERSALDVMMNAHPYLTQKRGAVNSFLNMLNPQRGN